jgi:hypothetical protein
MARPTISLVIADTDTYALALSAVKKCVSRFPFDRVLIFSDDPTRWESFTVTHIEPIRSQADYGDLLLNTLPQHLQTDFFLVVQFDGFILNVSEFSPHYFHYDYIGAPWGWFRSFNVGNGGFSWRSRKLAEAVARIGYSRQSKQLEDVFIGRYQRVLLEDAFGCQFASEALASHFSIEFGERRFPTFGFHGIFHLPSVYRNDLSFLVDNLTPRILRSDAQFRQIADALQNVSPSLRAELQVRRDRISLQQAGVP